MDRADILKVDFKRTTLEERGAMIKRYGPWRCRMLAEKVETHEEFHLARNQGFLYFQGYFFRKPEIMTAHEIPANRINYLRMLQAVSRAELDLREVENVLKSEASLCYRLLRYMNSAVFGFGSEIHSVRHALSLIGEREIRRWVRLVAAVGAGQQKSSELVLCALTRARFCELLAPQVQHGDSDLFFLGLLSLMDVILEMPMASVLEKVSVDHETKAVPLGSINHLRPLYQLMLAQVSYHIRNVPVLSTIEMSPSFGFTLPRNRERVPLRKSLFSRDDSELEEGCDVGSGMGARGKGQRPFPRTAL